MHSILEERFEEYGADYNATMERFGWNVEMYMRLFGMLFRDDNMNKLEVCIGKNDLKGAFEAAHTLKGVTGNMGLTPMYNAVCAIVEPLRAGNEQADYSELFNTIRFEYARVEKLRDDLKGGE